MGLDVKKKGDYDYHYSDVRFGMCVQQPCPLAIVLGGWEDLTRGNLLCFFFFLPFVAQRGKEGPRPENLEGG